MGPHKKVKKMKESTELEVVPKDIPLAVREMTEEEVENPPSELGKK